MIKIIATADVEYNQEIVMEMYSSRAKVFKDRLKWSIDVIDGLEMDAYDRIHDPVYIIAKDRNENITGSLRILPTTGKNMLGEEFKSLFDPEVNVMSPTVWECTRFCVHPNVRATESRYVATELLHELCKLARASGIEHIVGVYEASMLGVYRQIGWSPETLARSRPIFGNLMVGLWAVNEENEAALARRLTVLGEAATLPGSGHRPTIPAVNARPSF